MQCFPDDSLTDLLASYMANVSYSGLDSGVKLDMSSEVGTIGKGKSKNETQPEYNLTLTKSHYLTVLYFRSFQTEIQAPPEGRKQCYFIIIDILF